MTPLEFYKYLGIYKADSINCPKTKQIVQAEYFRHLRKVLSSQLHAMHKIMAFNEFAIPVLRYSATIIDWTKNELQVLDHKTRKTFTMNGDLHPRADVDRIYVQRTLGGRGLLGVEDTVSFECVALYYYFRDHTDVLMKKVLSSGFVKTPADISIVPNAFKDHLNVTHFQNWQDKPLHGQYVWNLQDITCSNSFGWLVHSDLKIETENLILAAQDQALNTKYYNASIFGGSDPYVISVALTMKLLHTFSLAVQLWWEHHTRSVIMQLDAACIGVFVHSLASLLLKSGGNIILDLWKNLRVSNYCGTLLLPPTESSMQIDLI